jgi:hypothetical protein
MRAHAERERLRFVAADMVTEGMTRRLAAGLPAVTACP